MSDPDAQAFEVRSRHGVTLDGTCQHCLPPGTPWPCAPFQTVARVIDRIAAERFPPIHPDWLDGR